MTSQGDLQIRCAAGADEQAVWPLVSRFATSFEPQREAFHTAWAQLVDSPEACVLVAETAAEGVVGYLLAFVHPTFFANAPVAWVEEVMVSEEGRRAGVGTALMGGAEQWSTRRGAAYIALATRRAASFYLALDYEESATFFKKNL